MKSHILVVASDTALRATLARWLMAAGYGVELAESPKRAREVVASGQIELAVFAPDRLGAAGLDLARDLHNSMRLITIAEPADGARFPFEVDGSIANPLNQEKVLDRIRNVLDVQSTGAEQTAPEILRFAGCTLDVVGHRFLDASGKAVPLTRSEFALLVALARRRGRVLSRDELREAVSSCFKNCCSRPDPPAGTSHSDHG